MSQYHLVRNRQELNAFLCTFKMSQQSGRGKIWHTRFKIYIKVSYEAWITFSDISQTATENLLKRMTAIPCPVSGDAH